MDVGVIGLGRDGCFVVRELLAKTAYNVFAYDPDGRRGAEQAYACRSAAEVCERCEIIVVALESATELTHLYNAVAAFISEDQIFVDLTPTSPSFAHDLANNMRRVCKARYIDCGVFGAGGMREPFIMFAGGNSKAFSRARPLIRCFAPDCRYMGVSGRGRAARLICSSLAMQLQSGIEEATELAQSFGIDKRYFLDSLADFERIADPLAPLSGESAAFSREELHDDAQLAAEMARRAGLRLDGLFAAAEKNLNDESEED